MRERPKDTPPGVRVRQRRRETRAGIGCAPRTGFRVQREKNVRELLVRREAAAREYEIPLLEG